MKRRSAIRNLVLFTGGMVLMPGCREMPGGSPVRMKNFTIVEGQEQLLADIVSVIVPETDSPGAGELEVHLFVLKMLDDLYEKKEQSSFLAGLDQVDLISKKQYGRSFLQCSGEEKEKMLVGIEAGAGYPEEVVTFYRITKERTVQGYLHSKYVMSHLIKYEMIPSKRYDGYYRVKNS